ncbi:hypothetical protein GS429_16230 [Natronorubrum sp. JWXQ-INN-674]|uniref:CobW/HypB/UreG nucleotide-binding domain-containing protein n=1 Tax=Natronorubrum halalkaliphilum TaxID=2691917 RepID=A0A6B0VRJ2_9EURY|nr:hypothetical protein [Natronorubrum halalkaliphilum]
MPDNSIPVTVLSGILGAGETTVCNVLCESDDRDLPVLVNDTGEVNVGEIPEESREDERGVKRPVSRAELAREQQFDGIAVESTGIAEPLPVAQRLTLGFDSARTRKKPKQRRGQSQSQYPLTSTTTRRNSVLRTDASLR